MRREDGEPDLFSASEALEAAADQRPFDYDFLGKAIDTGFRVAGAAKPERFVLSVQLARLLASAPPGFGFDYEIRLDQPIFLKGVNRGEPYPVLYIDTMTHLSVEGIRKKERALLNPNGAPGRELLADYLHTYCQVVGTDEIMLPADTLDEVPLEPASYSEHREAIAEHLRQERGRGSDGMKEDETDPADGTEEIPAGEDLAPLQDDD